MGDEILDVPFPDVPPTDTPEQIATLGDALVLSVLLLSPSAIMVQGEFTLAFYLVEAFEYRGIPCFAATTRRVPSETTILVGGAVEKRSRFEFVRLRRYPRPH